MLVCFSRPRTGIQLFDADMVEIIRTVAEDDGNWNLVFCETEEIKKHRSGYTIATDNPHLYEALSALPNVAAANCFDMIQTAYLIGMVLIVISIIIYNLLLK